MSVIFREFKDSDQTQIDELSSKYLGRDNFLMGRFNSVAVDSKTNEIVGFSSMILGMEATLYAVDFDESIFRSGYFNGVCLKEEYRGRGISHEMYNLTENKFLDYQRKQYDKSSSAFCFSHIHENNFASQSYHRRLGFSFLAISPLLRFSVNNNLLGPGAAYVYKKELTL